MKMDIMFVSTMKQQQIYYLIMETHYLVMDMSFTLKMILMDTIFTCILNKKVMIKLQSNMISILVMTNMHLGMKFMYGF